jgi:hypothetical protein
LNRRARIESAIGLLIGLQIGLSGCADRSPPARFREAPPPTLARPLAPDEPQPDQSKSESESESSDVRNEDVTDATDPSEDSPSEPER